MHLHRHQYFSIRSGISLPLPVCWFVLWVGFSAIFRNWVSSFYEILWTACLLRIWINLTTRRRSLECNLRQFVYTDRQTHTHNDGQNDQSHNLDNVSCIPVTATFLFLFNTGFLELLYTISCFIVSYCHFVLALCAQAKAAQF